MMGSLSQKGVIPRLCDELFERISNVGFLLYLLGLGEGHSSQKYISLPR